MTFVILTGGIDLSVGAVVALSTMIAARRSSKTGWPPTVVMLARARRSAPTLGLLMGCVIHYFDIQPFIVTLAGMFLARGLCYAISVGRRSRSTNPTSGLDGQSTRSACRATYFAATAVIALVVGRSSACTCLHYTRFGRNVYAIGGNEQSRC